MRGIAGGMKRDALAQEDSGDSMKKTRKQRPRRTVIEQYLTAAMAVLMGKGHL
jgi:hypothetical protein